MIGIIGAYGDVGLNAARMLYEWGKHPLRMGGRNAQGAKELYSGEFPQAEWLNVDIEDEQSLYAFVQGCTLIVNCAGPSYRTAARVAQACLEKSCRLVDAGVDKSMEALGRESGRPLTVLYGAGATPGLSALLPRWLGQAFDRVDSLVCYTGVLNRFTAAAAQDYLAGVSGSDNQPLAAWKDGICRPSALRRKQQVRLPFFPREVTLYPYIDREARFVASTLSLRDGEWYITGDGRHVPAVLDEARLAFSTDRQYAVKRLCEASALDSAGRQNYIRFLLQLIGSSSGSPIARTLILEAGQTSLLTGATAGAAAMAVLEGEVAAGVRPLAEISDPAKVVDRLRSANCINQFHVADGRLEDLLQAAEGEL